jgi:hypothetical protein
LTVTEIIRDPSGEETLSNRRQICQREEWENVAEIQKHAERFAA